MNENGLHYHDTRNRQITMVSTVSENEKCFSQQAKAARELYARVGHPSIRDFKNMVKAGMIMNCPITVDDVIRAEKFYIKREDYQSQV